MKLVPVSVRNLAAGALIVGATLVSYWASFWGDFIWNDSDYVTAPALRSLSGLVRIWTELGATEQYYPLLHTAFWVQHRLFGDHPLGYHLATVLLHAGAAVLFALVLRRLFEGEPGPAARRETPGSAPAAGGGERARHPGTEWLAALLFALHPVHVESVAWITEQKNTLSLVFYLAAALLYLRYDETRRTRTYGAALALFAASLLCKTVTATLPAALLVVLWWKRERLAWRRDIRPLVPWLVLGAAAGFFSSWVEWSYGHAHGGDFQISLVGRVLVAGRAVWFYAANLVWPFGLNFIYPRWTIDAAAWWQWLFPLGVLAAGAGLWALRRRARGPLVRAAAAGLAAYWFFVGSLFPVLGFVNLYGARFSWVWDHWQYLADLGPLALAAAGLAAAWGRLAARFRWAGWLGRGMVAALAVLLGALTWSHGRMFHDDVTLYRATLARNPGAWMAHYNLGVIWSKTPGRSNDAVARFEEALRLKPDLAEAHTDLGDIRLKTPGQLNGAIAEYLAALRLKPESARAHYNLGVAWSHVPGRLDDAIAEYEAALRLKPDFAEAHDNLGVALAHVPGRLDDAIAQFETALRLQPEFAGAHNNLGLALSQTPSRLQEAIAHYQEALRLKPDFAPAWHNLGVGRYQLGDLAGAAAAFREELRLSPNDPAARQALDVVQRRIEGH
ncbi:MAG TPA: tetratricopeptide repeat protein [Opitutaceae bacterium]|nr:tetratricopeptide repeat protein [Opitutaceae bacterium]